MAVPLSKLEPISVSGNCAWRHQTRELKKGNAPDGRNLSPVPIGPGSANQQ